MKTILIVDNDLGFAFWLGHALDEAGEEAWPARSIPDGLELISRLNLSVDVAVVNASLSGVPAFFEELRRNHPAVKIIAVYEESREVPAVVDADIALCKRDAVDETTKMHWMQAIRSLLGANAAPQS